MDKTPSPDQLPVSGPWSISQGQQNGKVMIVRSNTGYKEFGSVPGYEHQVGIAIRLKEVEETGLPTPAEGELLWDLEDTICESLEEEAESLFVATITTGGMREFVFYTREPLSVKRRFEQLQKQVTSHEMQLMIQPDRVWGAFARFA